MRAYVLVVVAICVTTGVRGSPVPSGRITDADGFIFDMILPGISRRNVVFEPPNPPTTTTTTEAPIEVISDPVESSPVRDRIVFGNSDVGLPISFGDEQGDTGRDSDVPLILGSPTRQPTSTDGTTEIMKTTAIHPDDGSGSSQLVLFPGEPHPSKDDQPIGDSVDSDGFLFPSINPTPFPATLSNQTNSSNDNITTGPCTLKNGNVMVNGSCHRLLKTGSPTSSCNEGEWLIMRESKVECQPRPCPFDQLHYDGKCVSPSDTSICAEGQMLFVSFSGETYCDCEPGFLYDLWSGECHAEFDQGPCNFGEYLRVSSFGNVECVRNPCLMDGYLYHNETGLCYRKMYSGSCEKQFLQPFPNNRTIECMAVYQRTIFDVPTMRACPQGSLRGYRNECREEFRIPSHTSYPSQNGRCGSGFRRDPRGTCRRVHRLFGR